LPAHRAADLPTTTITAQQPIPPLLPGTYLFTATYALGGVSNPTQTTIPASGSGISTVTPFPSVTPFPTATPIPTATSLSPGPGFSSVTVADSRIYWGICRGNKTKFTVQVTDPEIVSNVVIFIRLKDYKSDDTTPWSKGAAMNSHGDGSWTYTLRANNIDEHTSYRRSWVMYQFALEDERGEVSGRTHVYTNNITLEPCMCMTPPCD
jgi:hypothetical protein